MRPALLLIVSLLFGLSTAELAIAEVRVGRVYGYGGFGYGGYGYGGYGFGGGTAAGNYMMGMSQVVRSAGEYNYYTSMAAINNEEARSQYLDNQKKWSQNYFQMKEERQKLDVQQREINRQRNDAANAQRASQPPVYHGLGQNSFDRVTGKITWPELLMSVDYDEPRKEIDQLFELRSKTGSGLDTAAKVRNQVDKMNSRLRKDIEKVPANQYMAARKFLDAVDYTSRYESPRDVGMVDNSPPSPKL